MNEQELRQAMRATMATASAPPPMNESPVLDAARRAERRRRNRWAGVGSAAAAIAVVGIAVVVVAATSGAGGSGAAGPGVATTTSTTSGTASSDTSNVDEPTEPSWPNGQTDRTAQKGPEYDRGVALLEQLDAVVPAGYEAPHDLEGNGDLAGAPMSYHQAQYADTVNGTEVWEYLADAIVTKDGRYGRLLAEVRTPGNGYTGDGCDIEADLWGMTGKCTEIVVDGKRVGVYNWTGGTDDQFEQWAAYRHDDGTVVFIGQSAHRAYTNFPPLAGLPLTAKRLAELAADPGFKLG